MTAKEAFDRYCEIERTIAELKEQLSSCTCKYSAHIDFLTRDIPFYNDIICNKVIKDLKQDVYIIVMENSDFVIINAESMWDLVHAIAYYQPKHMDMFLNKFVLHRLQGTYLQAIQKIAKCKDEETKLKLLNLLESGTEDNINLINTLSI